MQDAKITKSVGKTNYHHGDLRSALLESGIALLEEKGLADLSLRQIAARTGVTHTAPQNHFGNLAGLLTAMATVGYGQLFKAMTKGVGEDAPRDIRRDRALLGYVEFATKNPALYELMFSRDRVLLDDASLQENVRACFLVLDDLSKGLSWLENIDETGAKGQVFVWSLVHGYAQLVSAGRLKKDDMKTFGILDIFPK